ncbi:MAG: hypothetical protein RBT37_03585 [Dissulfurispiraceae bacterium]|nr:hypothetical protein [Dissulfurispiraceae bacterium]
MIIDRVIAVVNDEPVIRSKFLQDFEKLKIKSPSITSEEALQSIINRMLIYQDAKKMRLNETNPDNMIKEYFDIKVESGIIIKEEEIQTFFNENKKEFGEKEYLDVHDEIERYLYELTKNNKIKELINTLRTSSDIRVRLKD